MNMIKEFIKETLKIYITLCKLFLMIMAGLVSILLTVIGIFTDWKLFALGLLALSAWIAFINITNKTYKKGEE